jgi:hypothetical protein
MLRRWQPGSVLLFLLAVLGLSGLQTSRVAGQNAAPLLTPEVRKAMEALPAAGIRAHVRFLADDMLEGRDTATPGGELAARYLAAQFEQAGLTPGGDGGSYFQRVPFVRTRFNTAESEFSLRAGARAVTLRGGEDFLLNGESVAVPGVEGPVVFAGYGITAPEYRYDDYQDLDVREKWVMVLTGEPRSADPAFFDGEKETRYSDGAWKQALARSRGARGLITVLIGERGERYPWDRVRRSQETSRFGLAPEGDALPAIVVRERSAARLFEVGGQNWNAVEQAIAKGRVPAVKLAGQGRLTLMQETTAAPAPNVVGYLEGADPRLKEQVVVYSAHYDHIGSRAGTGDTVFNGAWDNASGTAEVVEIARTFARLPSRPRRSVLFLLVTGEEKGLLGSAYYVREPVFPMEATAANINLDMTEIFGVGKDLVPQGAEYSTLMRSSEAVAKALGLKIGKDPTPELNVFTRSDQFSFVRAGVPSLFLRWSNEHEGMSREESRAAGKRKLDTIYHKEADHFDPTWSWEGMRRHAQAAFLLGLDVAQRAEMPEWNEDAPFKRPRKRPGAQP